MKSRQGVQIVKETDLSKDKSILSGRLFNSIKHRESEKRVPNSRCDAHGHTSQTNDILVHDVGSLRQNFVVIILSNAAIKKVRVFNHVLKQAYLQSKDQLSREIYSGPEQRLQIVLSA